MKAPASHRGLRNLFSLTGVVFLVLGITFPGWPAGWTTKCSAEPPPNDECENAIVLTGPGAPCESLSCLVPFSTEFATTDGPDPECDTEFGSDIWYEIRTSPTQQG